MAAGPLFTRQKTTIKWNRNPTYDFDTTLGSGWVPARYIGESKPEYLKMSIETSINREEWWFVKWLVENIRGEEQTGKTLILQQLSDFDFFLADSQELKPGLISVDVMLYSHNTDARGLIFAELAVRNVERVDDYPPKEVSFYGHTYRRVD